MNRARSQPRQRREMLRRAVALVLRKAVAGKLPVAFEHLPVARHLGQHACRGNGEAAGIALDQRCLRPAQRRHKEAVHQRVLGRRREGGEGGVHRLMRGLQDVDRIDGRGIHGGDGKADFGECGQGLKKTLPLAGAELLGIVQARQLSRQAGPNPDHGKIHRGRHHRPSQRPAPGLIHARDAHAPVGDVRALEGEPVDGCRLHFAGLIVPGRCGMRRKNPAKIQRDRP